MNIIVLAAGLLALALPASAQEDPIVTRQLLMTANGNSAAVAGNVMRGNLEYDPAVGRAAIATMRAVSQAFGDYFPEGSLDTERSDAAPAIWEDMAGFRDALEDFRAAAVAAADASGEDGPPDAEAFAAAVQPVLGTCRDCHETYRLDR